MKNAIKINYITYNDEKLLPFQYYNKFNYKTMPVKNKIPFIKNWTNIDKTIEPQYIFEGLNTALVCGQINNITVVDIDVKDNGLKYWNKLQKNRQEILTPIVKTPSGGLHYYFKYEQDIPTMNRINVDGNRVGIDVRNDNSICILPPSTNYKFKKNYSLQDIKVKKMPKYIKNFLIENMKESTRKKYKY